MSAPVTPQTVARTAGRAPADAPAKLRILVVDDSAVIRRVVTDVLNADPQLEVVGTAANGRIALDKVSELEPDLITLDVEMPEMDGLAMLSQLRLHYRKTPVIMFSSLTERAGAITIEALARGAADYVTKPAGSGNLAAAMASIRQELVPKVKAVCARQLARNAQQAQGATVAPARPGPARPGAAPAAPAVPAVPVRGAVPTAAARPAGGTGLRASGRVDVLAIGVSTGGPNALGQLLPSLRGLPVPIVIVQHMPPLFTKLLSEQLTSSTGIPVSEGANGMALEPGKAYIAPGDHHMVLQRDGTQTKIALNQGPAENSCRPAVDVLFRSVAGIYGANTLAVVLTGMGSDGEKGAGVIRQAGGQVLAQDEPSSVVWGMPGAVVKAGLANAVLPLGELGGQILSLVGRPGGR